MTKTIPEIDEDAIKRAQAVYLHCTTQPLSRRTTKEMLEAALTPEPEIEVTEAMLDAGNEAWNQCAKDLEPSKAARNNYLDNIMRAIHRAMVKAAPAGAKSAPPAYVYWDKNDRRQRGVIVTNDRREGDRRGRDRFAKAQEGAAYAAKSAPQGVNAAAPEKATGGVVGDTVAVGFPTGRDDGLVSLHIDGTTVLLDDAERNALVRLLQQPSALRREPEYYANVK
jgi:hypothetical protein